MKAIVDAETCVGCGLCEGICPEVFKMDGSVAKVVGASVPAAAAAKCKEAAEGCPVEAITIK